MVARLMAKLALVRVHAEIMRAAVVAGAGFVNRGRREREGGEQEDDQQA